MFSLNIFFRSTAKYSPPKQSLLLFLRFGSTNGKDSNRSAIFEEQYGKKEVDDLQTKKFKESKFAHDNIGTDFIPTFPQPIDWKIPLPEEIKIEKAQWESYRVEEQIEFDILDRFKPPINLPEDSHKRVGLKVHLPTERHPEFVIDENGLKFSTAKGTRKRSKAFAILKEGTGIIQINGKCLTDYFSESLHREKVVDPLFLTETFGSYDVDIKVTGGGLTGQSEAIVLALSRALEKFEPGWRNVLKAAGYMRRDPREVERKKPGQPKARKKFQWVKRQVL